jgi:acyl carrier protein
MDRLTNVFREVFDSPELEIDNLSRANFPAWDSLAQVKLVIGIEEEFDVKFTIDQVSKISSAKEFQTFLSGCTRV